MNLLLHLVLRTMTLMIMNPVQNSALKYNKLTLIHLIQPKRNLSTPQISYLLNLNLANLLPDSLVDHIKHLVGLVIITLAI